MVCTSLALARNERMLVKLRLVFSKWGFTSYLRETFTAPDPVMAYLCNQYGVHRIPIGSQKTLDVVDQVRRRHAERLPYFIIRTEK